MTSRLKQFHFRWYDAWLMTVRGYDTILETSDSGRVSIECLVNMEPQSLDLTGRVDEFIKDLECC